MYSKMMDNGSEDPIIDAGTNMLQLQGGISLPAAAPPKELDPPVVVNKAEVLLGPNQTTVDCPFCHRCVKTTTQKTTTTRTHLLAFKCFFVCCCCCLPYCMDSAKNTDHFCPSCNRYLGTYEM